MNRPDSWRDDRGLHYGDGLFETIRYAGAKAPLWECHQQRLAQGCVRLGLPMPDWQRLQQRLSLSASAFPQSIVKLIWTAGNAPRGYARPEQVKARALIQTQAWQPGRVDGLVLRWCDTRLALQPALAGLKHLNRLEQVLARAEWNDPQFDEGLMLDMQGRVIAATAANVLIRLDGRWLTADLGACGVAGVARRWWMSRCAVTETTLVPEQVMAAQAVVLTNAVRGPRQVAELQDRRWSKDDEVAAQQRAWEQQFAASEPTP